MNYFFIVENESGGATIKFKEHYNETNQKYIKNAFNELGAVYKCWEREGYGFEYCEWYMVGDHSFTYLLVDAKWCIDGNIEVISKIENALIASNFFQKVPSEN